ncbi:hypothetical protein A9263_15195 [Vibrio cyclitrophicus]|nr:hypothetical protein A9263_15195 [Vibrio cyclitrophicus]
MIFIPAETYVIPDTISTIIKNKNLAWSDIVELSLAKLNYHEEFSTIKSGDLAEFCQVAKRWPKEKQKVGNLYYELYFWIAKEHEVKCKFVGDKTPLNTLRLGLIKYMHPNANFIYIERDPVDVCYSYVEAGLQADYHTAIERWKISVQSWKKFKSILKKGSYVEIKYEDLVSNYEHIIKAIGEKFSLPERETPFEVTDNALGDVASLSHHKNVMNKPSTKSIGKGRKNIDEINLSIVRNALNGVEARKKYREI